MIANIRPQYSVFKPIAHSYFMARFLQGWRLLLLMLIITAFSVIVYPGYRVFVSDHLLYVPAIEKSLNPELYDGDLLLEFNQSGYTIFDEVVVFMVSGLGMDIFHMLILLTFFVRLIFYYSVYRIVLYFTGDGRFSLFSIFIFLAGSAVYGTAFLTMDVFLTARLISISLCLLFLALFLNGRKILSSVPLGAAFLFNPPITVPFVLFFYTDIIYSLYRERSIDRYALAAAPVPVFFFIFMLSITNSSGLGAFGTIDPVWASIMMSRIPYAFLTGWSHISYFYLLAGICMLAVAGFGTPEFFSGRGGRKGQRADRQSSGAIRRRHLLMLIMIPVILTALSFVTIDIMKLNLAMQMNLTRSLFLLKIFITFMFSYYAYLQIKSCRMDLLYNFSLIGIILSFVFQELLLVFFLPVFLFLWARKSGHFTVITKTRLFRSDVFVASGFAVYASVLMAAALFVRNDPATFIYLLSSVIVSLVSSMALNCKKKFYAADRAIPYIFIALAMAAILLFPFFSIYPSYYSDQKLMEACGWIRGNTDVSDMFVTEPFTDKSGAVRMTCERGVFVSYKDGAQVGFNRDYAAEWKKRIGMLQSFEENPETISSIAGEYGLDYIISEKEIDAGYPLEFDNGRYFIYRIS